MESERSERTEARVNRERKFLIDYQMATLILKSTYVPATGPTEEEGEKKKAREGDDSPGQAWASGFILSGISKLRNAVLTSLEVLAGSCTCFGSWSVKEEGPGPGSSNSPQQ